MGRRCSEAWKALVIKDPESTWNTWALRATRSSLALIQLAGLRPNPALPRSSQWAPKACLAGSLPGPVSPSVNAASSPISSFACGLNLALPAGVLLSPPLSLVRSWHPGCFPSSALVSSQSPRPRRPFTCSRCSSGSAQSGTALQPPTSPVQDSDRPFLCSYLCSFPGHPR